MSITPTSTTPTAGTIRLAGRELPRIGLGTMQFTGRAAMGAPADPERCRAVLQQAVAGGIRLIDTSAYYGPAHANLLLAEALHPYRDELVIATKVGARRTPDGGFIAATAPAEVRAAVHENLAQLRLERLPLVHARNMPDSDVPFDDVVGTLAGLRDEGLIAEIGVSNVDVALLDSARRIAPIASVENELSLARPGDAAVVEATAATGIPMLAFRPLGDGTLLRRGSPLLPIAAELGVSPATLALAWVLRRAPHIAAIPGTSDPGHLGALLDAADLVLDDDTAAALDDAFEAQP